MTGHKGLIGTFLLEQLTKRGDAPALLVDTRDGKDICDIQKERLSEPVDVMIHLASFCKINKTIEDPQTAFDANVQGMHEVMEFCRKNAIPKIVFASSSRVLSKEKNPYTASKLYGEELVKGYADSYGMEYVIIRPSTVYGPFNDYTGRLVDIFIRNALLDEPLVIYGNEQKTLDFTYVDDFVAGILLAMEQTNKEYDISSGTETNVGEVADLIISLAGKGTKEFRTKEVAQPQTVSLDIRPMKAIGYEPTVSIEEGITKTFAWYKEHLQEVIASRT